MKKPYHLLLSIEYVIDKRGCIVEHRELTQRLTGNQATAQKKARGIHDDLIATQQIQHGGHYHTLTTILFPPQGEGSVSVFTAGIIK